MKAAILLIALLITARSSIFLSASWANIGARSLKQSLLENCERDASCALGQVAEAYGIASEYDPLNGSAHRGLGFALLVGGNEQEAIESWRIAGGMEDELMEWAEVAHAEREYEWALAWLERAILLDPEDEDAWVFLGSIHELNKQWQEALDAYGRAINLKGSNSVRFGWAGVHYRIGRILQWHTDPSRREQALQAFNQALAEGDFDFREEEADTYYNRGLIYWWQRPRYSKADYLAEFQSAVKLDPLHAWANLMMGRVHFLEGQNFQLAKAFTMTSLELSPTNEWGLLYLADILVAQGGYDEAVAYYQAALEINSDLDEAREQLRVLGNN